MQKLSLEQIFSQIKGPLSAAIKTLRRHRETIVREWSSQRRKLGIDQAVFESLGDVNCAALMRGLRADSFRPFQRLAYSLGETLAERKIKIETAIAAYGLLLEICLHYLDSERGNKASQALSLERLYSMALPSLVAGHASHRRPEIESLEVQLAETQERIHKSAAYITRVYERERRRFSHDLHDEIGHDLMLLKLYLEIIARDIREGATQPLGPKIEEAIDLVSHTIESVRRLVLDLGPAILDDLGLVPAIKFYTRRFTANTGIKVHLQVGQMAENVPLSHQVTLYRVLQGALSNVLEHARASNVSVTLGCMKESILIVVIQDDGAGFDLSRTLRSGSVGLTAMRERVETLGGRFHLESTPAGSGARPRGTRIEIDLPLPESTGSSEEKNQSASV
jgi:signal transduction histidine kinase